MTSLSKIRKFLSGIGIFEFHITEGTTRHGESYLFCDQKPSDEELYVVNSFLLAPFKISYGGKLADQ